MDEPKPKRKIARTVRAAIIGVLACVILLTVGGYIASEIEAWHLVQELAQDEPGLDLLPKPLVDRRVAQLEGPRIERYGISFQVPWKESAKERHFRSLEILAFAGGGSVMILDPAQLGPFATTGYESAAASFQTSRADARWWWTPGKNRRTFLLLMEKSNLVHPKDTVLYRVEGNGYRGFQSGDPEQEPFTVTLHLFDEHDRHYEIILATSKGAAHPAITQPEINAIVASMRPAKP
ncbi:hypothetical protein [Granulicella rosea]|uniref:hypothetical protein n=1 Tax=Granulicella rosea TaxID=474952 RepID=UPI000B7944F4|nr:hypothetical protein [Granulicella rosea]